MRVLITVGVSGVMAASDKLSTASAILCARFFYEKEERKTKKHRCSDTMQKVVIFVCNERGLKCVSLEKCCLLQGRGFASLQLGYVPSQNQNIPIKHAIYMNVTPLNYSPKNTYSTTTKTKPPKKLSHLNHHHHHPPPKS